MKRYLALFSLILFFSSCISQNSSISDVEIIKREKSLSLLVDKAIYFLSNNEPSNLKKAKDSLLLAKEISPLDERVLDGLGCVFYIEKNYKKAEKYFKKSIEVNPSYASGWAHLALIAEREGDLKAAKFLHEKALEYAPLDYRARNNYAVFLAENVKKSSRLYKKAKVEIRKANSQVEGKEGILRKNLEIISN